jgi:hypothetical protein
MIWALTVVTFLGTVFVVVGSLYIFSWLMRSRH